MVAAITNKSDAKIEQLYRQMKFIRHFEERLLELFEEGLLNGTTHCYIGQEANAVGVISNLSDKDHIFSNHRCHGHYLARTGDAYGLLTEMMGKEDGICRGIGGSQHICASDFKSNGILGGTVPTAAGIAMAIKLDGSDAISVVCMGDGAMGEGVVYETLNIASLWDLPILFLVENNLWSQSTPIRLNMKGTIADRFAAFRIPAVELSTTDVLEIDKAAADIIREVREHRKPRALVIETYRLCSHSKSSDGRPEDEVEARWAGEPLTIHGPRLEADCRTRIDDEVIGAVEDVIERARKAQ